MTRLLHLIVLAALPFLSGCTMHRLIKINADASAIIDETFLADVAGFESPAPADGKEELPPGQTLEMTYPDPTAEKASTAEKALGKGVRLISWTRIDDGKQRGYHAVYQVQDISLLNAEGVCAKVPSYISPELNEDKITTDKAGPPATRTFQFSKGATFEMTIPAPAEESKEQFSGNKATRTPGQESTVEQKENVKRFAMALEHLDLLVAFEFPNSIQETNAKYRDGNKIILLELNGIGFFQDPKYAKDIEALKTGGGPKTLDHPAENLPNEYFKMEQTEPIRVKF